MKCITDLRKTKKKCENKECRHWINCGGDLNCVLEAVKNNSCSGMTLREVAKRLGLSFVRIKQIESIALKKIRQSEPELFEYLLKDDF